MSMPPTTTGSTTSTTMALTPRDPNTSTSPTKPSSSSSPTSSTPVMCSPPTPTPQEHTNADADADAEGGQSQPQPQPQQPQTQTQTQTQGMEFHRKVLEKRLLEQGGQKAYISPSDTIMSPCTAKLSAYKSKHFLKAKPQSLFGKLEAAKKSNFGNEDVGS